MTRRTAPQGGARTIGANPFGGLLGEAGDACQTEVASSFVPVHGAEQISLWSTDRFAAGSTACSRPVQVRDNASLGKGRSRDSQCRAEVCESENAVRTAVSRRAQGLPPRVSDPAVLARIRALASESGTNTAGTNHTAA
jgi:hypothetical protein